MEGKGSEKRLQTLALFKTISFKYTAIVTLHNLYLGAI